MLRTESPEAWPGGRIEGNLPIPRGRTVEMKCWTEGPLVDHSQKWFYVRADQFPYDQGYVPANTVGRQDSSPLCPAWTTPSAPSSTRG